jgi:hypothetical protein
MGQIEGGDEKKLKSDQDRLLFLREADLITVRKSHAQNIKKAAFEGRLQQSDRLLWLLQCWKNWSGTDDASEWATAFVSDLSSAITITMAAVNITTSIGSGGPQRSDSLLLQWLEQFVDLEKIWGYFSVADLSLLDVRHQNVIKLFERGLSNKKLGQQYELIRDPELLSHEEILSGVNFRTG